MWPDVSAFAVGAGFSAGSSLVQVWMHEGCDKGFHVAIGDSDRVA